MAHQIPLSAPLTPSPTPSPPAEERPLQLEPRFSLPDSTPTSSKHVIVIGGIATYVFGLDEIAPDAEEVAVLYLAHMRTRTYQVTEGMAHELLHQYKRAGRNKISLIAVTMDMRNHGAREVSRIRTTLMKDKSRGKPHLERRE